MLNNTVILVVWLVVGFVWLISAFKSKRTEQFDSSHFQKVHLVLALLAYLVGFSKYSAIEPLTRRVAPASPFVNGFAAFLLLSGAAFAIWARLQLGSNWSGTVVVKQDHALITGGPYRFVRHPIYTGLLLALLGTVIARNEVRGIIAFGLIVLLLALKARREERLMTQKFGQEYRDYCARVRGMIPYVW